MNNVSVIILYSKDKKILLQHRTGDAPKYPNMWSFFGGAIENGETPIEAVRRECLEELEYPLDNPLLVLKTKRKDKSTKYFFIERYNPKKKLILKEGKDLGWFKIEYLNNIDMAPDYEKVLEKIKRHFK